MKDLIKALQIFSKYDKGERYPTCCEHDIFMVLYITEEEIIASNKFSEEKPALNPNWKALSQTLFYSELFTKKELKKIERYTNIIDINTNCAYFGLTNSVKYYNAILSCSIIDELDSKHEWYAQEKEKVETLTSICSEFAMEPVFFNL